MAPALVFFLALLHLLGLHGVDGLEAVVIVVGDGEGVDHGRSAGLDDVPLVGLHDLVQGDLGALLDDDGLHLGRELEHEEGLEGLTVLGVRVAAGPGVEQILESHAGFPVPNDVGVEGHRHLVVAALSPQEHGVLEGCVGRSCRVSHGIHALAESHPVALRVLQREEGRHVDELRGLGGDPGHGELEVDAHEPAFDVGRVEDRKPRGDGVDGASGRVGRDRAPDGGSATGSSGVGHGGEVVLAGLT